MVSKLDRATALEEYTEKILIPADRIRFVKKVQLSIEEAYKTKKFILPDCDFFTMALRLTRAYSLEQFVFLPYEMDVKDSFREIDTVAKELELRVPQAMELLKFWIEKPPQKVDPMPMYGYI